MTSISSMIKYYYLNHCLKIQRLDRQFSCGDFLFMNLKGIAGRRLCLINCKSTRENTSALAADVICIIKYIVKWYDNYSIYSGRTASLYSFTLY